MVIYFFIWNKKVVPVYTYRWLLFNKSEVRGQNAFFHVGIWTNIFLQLDKCKAEQFYASVRGENTLCRILLIYI